MFYFLNWVVVTQVFSLVDNLLNYAVINYVFYGVHYLSIKIILLGQKAKQSNILYICIKDKHVTNVETNQFYKCYISFILL